MATTSDKRGLLAGYRSGLEELVAAQLVAANIEFSFESHRIRYTPPLKERTYSPDFILPNGIVIETKGRFVTADRQKHKIIQDQWPDIDIRFVFSSSRQKIGKKSKTTYAMWCDKYRFQWADKLIPEAWFYEPFNPASWNSLNKAKKPNNRS